MGCCVCCEGELVSAHGPRSVQRYRRVLSRAGTHGRVQDDCLLRDRSVLQAGAGEALGWETFSQTFPTAGMMRSGELFELPTLDYPACDEGSGLLPSPCARDGKDVSRTSAHLASRQRHQPSAATRLLESGLHWSMISAAYTRIMGFPSQWNVAASGNSATPSSRKFPNSSGGRSSKRKGKG